MIKHLIRLLSVTAVCACTQSQNPIIQYQFCVDVARDRTILKDTLAQFARQNGMQFLDRSAEAERESRAIDKNRSQFTQNYPLIMMTIWHDSGPSLTITNAGLPANQVVLGIAGATEKKSKTFVDIAYNYFSKRWKLIEVPIGSGAAAISCPELR